MTSEKVDSLGSLYCEKCEETVPWDVIKTTDDAQTSFIAVCTNCHASSRADIYGNTCSKDMASIKNFLTMCVTTGNINRVDDICNSVIKPSWDQSPNK